MLYSDNTRDAFTHGHHQVVNTKVRLIIFFAAKDGEAAYNQQKQDWEVTVAQMMNSLLQNSDLKEVGKASKPCRYDLNQMLYDYTVEAMNRFKRLDLVDRVPEALWMEFCNIVEEAMTKIISKKKKWKKCKMIV